MSPAEFGLRTIDARDGDYSGLDELRERLSPAGDVVSEASRAKTLETFGEALSPRQVVERICREVCTGGLSAVLDYSAKLDRAQLAADQLRVPEEDLAAAHRAADPEFLESIRRVRDRVAAFQSAVLHRDVRLDLSDSAYLEQRYVPLARVGVCVPGGAAAYPSTVLMTVVPAQAAGVREIAVIAPPTPFGAYNPDLLATCREIGVTEVYRVGGAHGVAALAYGVEGIARVDKIVGPGNLFVALAKQHVFGEVDIDSIAGPSEVIVIADSTSSAEMVAADLIAQAEHSPGASILVTWSEELIAGVQTVLAKQLAGLSRGELAAASLREFGLCVLVRDAEQAIEATNLTAPEHLHIQCRDAEAVARRTTTAGAVFVGPYSPVAVGDYAAGPSHVLPTSGTGRFASGLSANDFLRSHSVIHLDQPTLAEMAVDVERIATKEQLTAHWASVATRLGGENAS